MPLTALPTRTGARIDSFTPLRRQASSSGSETSTPSRYFGQHVVVGLGGGLEELVAAPGDLRLELGRDRDLDFLAAVPLPGLAVDEVDVARELLGRADREVERRDLVAERRAQGVQGGRGVGVLAIALVDEEARRAAVGAAHPDGGLQPGIHPAAGIHHEDHPVDRGDALDDLGDEVRVAGRVDEGHPRAIVVERGDREAQGLVALLLLGLEVERARAVVDAAEARGRAGPEKESFGERRLAAAGVPGQDDAPKVREVNALRRHRLIGPLW